MKGVSKMYLIQCERFECRTNSVVTRIFCDIDQGDVDPIELDFSGNHIGDSGVQALLWTVHTIRRLQKLRLSGCHMEEGATMALYEAFKDHPHLREVDIRGNPLFASSGRFLTMLLRANPNIHTLEVDTSEMPPRVEASLQRVLARNRERAFPEADRVAEEAKATEELRRHNVLSSKYLDSLLEGLHTPQPAEVMRAIQERVVHYWYLRLGPFAVLQLADRGINDSTIEYLCSLEKAYCDFSQLTKGVDTQAPLRSPSSFLLEEVDRINEASKVEGGILSRMTPVRGMTIQAQIESLNRLASMLREGVYQYGETNDLEASEDAPTAPVEEGGASSERTINVLAQMVEILHGFRTGVASLSLWDLIRYDPLEDTSPSSWAAFQADCKAFETEHEDANAAVVEVQYDRTRRLSLVCDMCRYLGINHPAFVEKVRGQINCQYNRGAESGGGELPSFEEAMSVYHTAMGQSAETPSDAPNDRTQPAAQRRELITEATSLFPPKAQQYLKYVVESRAYEAACRGGDGLGGVEDPSLVGLGKDSITAILTLTFPMYYYRPPPVSASEVVGDRSPVRSRVKDTPPARGVAPKVTNIGEELGGLRDKRRKEQEEAIARTKRLLYADSIGGELFDEVVHGGAGLVNGRDIPDILGSIQSKHNLRTFLLAVDAWQRYEFVISYRPSPSSSVEDK